MEQISRYKEANVKTTDRVKIISMLYDGAINYLRIAKEKMKEDDAAGKGYYIGKVTSIVGELSVSLNMEAGEIAQNMRRLYDFVLDRLLYANLKNDLKAFEEAERILDVLRVAWKEMETGLSNSDKTMNIKQNEASMELRI